MKTPCSLIHTLGWALPRHRFPFDQAAIPHDGIYFLFQDGERAHGGERIVRVGTHNGEAQLRSRLQQHFINENKDRSIFRKNEYVRWSWAPNSPWAWRPCTEPA